MRTIYSYAGSNNSWWDRFLNISDITRAWTHIRQYHCKHILDITDITRESTHTRLYDFKKIFLEYEYITSHSHGVTQTYNNCPCWAHVWLLNVGPMWAATNGHTGVCNSFLIGAICVLPIETPTSQVISWWRHQIEETFSALLAFCAGNSPVTGEFPAQRPVTRSFNVLFDLRRNGRLSKQWWGW